jgi:uncharacterized phage infection (PIP) family protein YhgE
MDPKIASEIKKILTEFDNIRSSLAPVVSEVRKIRDLQIELKRFKDEIDSRMKKMEFELRHTKQSGPSLKEIVTTKKQLDELRAQIDFVRKQPAAKPMLGDIQKELDRKVKEAVASMPMPKAPPSEKAFSGELDKVRAENKRAVSQLKSELREVDDKHTRIMSTTREKTAALITEADRLSKQVQEMLAKNNDVLKNIEEFENWFRQSEKTLMQNDQTRQKHITQIANELNNNRGDIHENRILADKGLRRIDDLNALLTKLERRQITELSEIKNRMRELERRVIFRHEVGKIQDSLVAPNEFKAMSTKVLEVSSRLQAMDLMKKRIDTISKTDEQLRLLTARLDRADERLASEFQVIRKQMELLGNRVDKAAKLVVELERLL